MAWLKIEVMTPDKPEIMAMALLLDIDPDSVFSKCFRIWGWADGLTKTGFVKGASGAQIDRIARTEKFSEAMMKVGWLIVTDGGITLPKFNRHNSQSAKTRALTNKRVALHRERRRGVTSVTESLPEERRGDKNRKERKTVTPCAVSDAESVYDLYPRKVGKGAAIPAIQKAVGRLTDRGVQNPVEMLREAVVMYAASTRGTESKFIPHPATWFNQDRHLDDRAAWVNRNGTAQKKNPDAQSAKDAAVMLAERGERERERLMNEYLSRQGTKP